MYTGEKSFHRKNTGPYWRASKQKGAPSFAVCLQNIFTKSVQKLLRNADQLIMCAKPAAAAAQASKQKASCKKRKAEKLQHQQRASLWRKMLWLAKITWNQIETLHHSYVVIDIGQKWSIPVKLAITTDNICNCDQLLVTRHLSVYLINWGFSTKCYKNISVLKSVRVIVVFLLRVCKLHIVK